MKRQALNILGIVVAVGAGLALTVGGLLISLVVSITPLQISGIRSIFAIMYILPAVAYFRPRILYPWTVTLELIGVSMIFAVKFLTFALGSVSLPLSEFSLLLNTMPLYTAILGCICLGEHCGIREISSGTLVIVGVLFVFIPPLFLGGIELTASVYGFSTTLTSAITNAIALVWLRRLQNMSSIVVSLSASVATAIFCLLVSWIIGEMQMWQTTSDGLYIASAGVCALLSSFLPALACSLTQASKVAIAMTSGVIFSFILQAVVQMKPPTIWSILGGIFIIAAVVFSNIECELCGIDCTSGDIMDAAASLSESGQLKISDPPPSYGATEKWQSASLNVGEKQKQNQWLFKSCDAKFQPS